MQFLDAEKRLADESETAILAARVVPLARRGDILALWGDLGSGKSVFARGFIRAACGEDDVPSPTFTLVQSYEAATFTIHHFDLYRLEFPEEAYELDIEDAFAEGVSLVEWPDRLGSLLPSERLDVILTQGDTENSRLVKLRGHGTWANRLKEFNFD